MARCFGLHRSLLSDKRIGSAVQNNSQPLSPLAFQTCVRWRLDPGSDHLRHEYAIVAIRANAVAELRAGARVDIALNLAPIIFVVAHFFAIGAKRNERLELLHLR